MNIYEEMKAAGVPLDNHCSDLYVKRTPEALAILERYEFKCNVRGFINQIDKTPWLDIPFAFAPYWEKR